jgi:hypothetical protein
MFESCLGLVLISTLVFFGNGCHKSRPGSPGQAARPAAGAPAAPSGFYPSHHPMVAENGDWRGADNDGDGRFESTHVRGYHRADGTYVRGHYRAQPGR